MHPGTTSTFRTAAQRPSASFPSHTVALAVNFVSRLRRPNCIRGAGRNAPVGVRYVTPHSSGVLEEPCPGVIAGSRVSANRRRSHRRVFLVYSLRASALQRHMQSAQADRAVCLHCMHRCRQRNPLRVLRPSDMRSGRPRGVRGKRGVRTQEGGGHVEGCILRAREGCQARPHQTDGIGAVSEDSDSRRAAFCRVQKGDAWNGENYGKPTHAGGLPLGCAFGSLSLRALRLHAHVAALHRNKLNDDSSSWVLVPAEVVNIAA
ncbi:hypothetical protein C8Q80DRAFT_939000 [Daedaleopsis nitida]|nr:hypothetical protein C8Q80DRAFT_939000 [Daedaleopsis nitida]